MSRFFSTRYEKLVPYTPGEQPRDNRYVKLNTNESPFPPSPGVLAAVAAESGRLQLYSDPECRELVEKLAEVYGVDPAQVMVNNGSDETLNFAFMAFADESHPLAFPDITYGFYPVFAELNHIPYEEIPLREDFRIGTEEYLGIGKTIVIANPNAPTGLCLGLDEIRNILETNPNNVVILDEAYVDFGAESALALLGEFDNLLVVRTFSKSRSMAGARLGFAIGSRELIADLNTIRFSTNPYNVNRMTLAAGKAALEEDDYYMANCRTIAQIRGETTARLRALGFTVLDSGANFVFARANRVGGEAYYQALKKRGVLVRHFNKARIEDFVRVTIGTGEQMAAFLAATEAILKGEQE